MSRYDSNGALIVTDLGDDGGNASLTSIDGKIVARAALADATANPTVSPWAAFLQGFNGTAWDRVRTGAIGAMSSVLGYVNVIPVGRYNASPPTLTDQQFINPQLDINGRTLVSERVQTFSQGETLTATTGTNWVALASGATRNITVRNRTGTSIDIRIVGSSTFFTMADGDTETYPVAANSNEWEIKRSDSSNTQVTIKFLRFA